MERYLRPIAFTLNPFRMVFSHLNNHQQGLPARSGQHPEDGGFNNTLG
jgi:hypothetical protein